MYNAKINGEYVWTVTFLVRLTISGSLVQGCLKYMLKGGDSLQKVRVETLITKDGVSGDTRLKV